MKNNRDYKNFVAGEYYHIYNRGNQKLSIFKDEEDYQVFLFYLNEAVYPEKIPKEKMKRVRRKLLPQGAFTLHTYCLMPNHYHLLIRQNLELSITELMHKISTSYSKYFNNKYGRIGSLFQDTFKAARIANYLKFINIVEYILDNPLRARLIKNISDYKWVSRSSESIY